MKKEKPSALFLTGFMGSGKTSVGKCLAQLTGLPFVDLDELIVRREGAAITDIFAQRGEKYFRDCESMVLQKLVKSSAVYATGGGIVLRAENRRRMHAMGRIVFLRTDWSTLRRRLAASDARPLINQSRDWEMVKELWIRRQPLYLDADMIIDTDNLNAMQVAEVIVSTLAREGTEP